MEVVHGPSLVFVAANIWIRPTGLSPLKTLGESDVSSSDSCVVMMGPALHSARTTSYYGNLSSRM